MLGTTGYKRLANDAYATPAWVTEALLDNVELPRAIWEPAAGDGFMVRVLSQRGHNVHATDITIDLDFLECVSAPDTQAIVTNPPYSLADKFIRHALDLMRPRRGMVAMLLRNEFDSAKKRADIFKNNQAFFLKLVLTKRPRWFADDKASPRHNFSWFCWDFTYPHAAPIIRWAP